MTVSVSDFRHSDSYRASLFAKASGYATCSVIGDPIELDGDTDAFGLLHGTEPIRRSQFWMARPRRPFVACLWFRNQARSVNGDHILIEVHGPSWLEPMTHFAQGVSEITKKPVHVALVSGAQSEY